MSARPLEWIAVYGKLDDWLTIGNICVLAYPAERPDKETRLKRDKLRTVLLLCCEDGLLEYEKRREIHKKLNIWIPDAPPVADEYINVDVAYIHCDGFRRFCQNKRQDLLMTGLLPNWLQDESTNQFVSVEISNSLALSAKKSIAAPTNNQQDGTEKFPIINCEKPEKTRKRIERKRSDLRLIIDQYLKNKGIETDDTGLRELAWKEIICGNFKSEFIDQIKSNEFRAKQEIITCDGVPKNYEKFKRAWASIFKPPTKKHLRNLRKLRGDYL
jgi:hypothetical protein